MHLETGIQRREDGTLLVAVRSDLHGCKGRMLDWWFTFFETTQHIRWWHPVDHVEHRGWDAAWQRGRSYHGASIHAVESLADIPPVAARLKFHDPRTLLVPQRLQAAQDAGDVSAVIAARIGFGDHVRRMQTVIPATGRCCTWRVIRRLAVCCAAASCSAGQRRSAPRGRRCGRPGPAQALLYGVQFPLALAAVAVLRRACQWRGSAIAVVSGATVIRPARRSLQH